ncbi:glycoside hydrolase family 13 protein [Aplosporella prunicola CBS 121167]|uniref:Glycoside hydrolase family 13 protein n=1 Tax=Aplosporella prunicola CBS 121167 TaxID=1176127 RepID=A0A6A6BKM6_9PEZI|nr:glycoside hydrolase family 13 protein [Aplosporella prunicola CBS 121167]KAF2143397.1 glycoside hydrolase family 13 protein [Aplosporella prunicola CBS 121167]
MGEQADEKREPTPVNGTLLQGFEWNVPADGKHWQRLTAALPSIKEIGITNLWLPPGCKGSSPEGNGYDIYDLYDLGEFDQKGSVRTKWGTLPQLRELSQKAQEQGVGLYWDAVLNHKAGADNKEKCQAVEVDEEDRNQEVGDPYEIEAWLGFDFPGRGDKYSSQKYHWQHFTGTDWNAANEKKAVYKICGEGKGWSESVGKEQGNADYMMFADLDYSHDEVIEDTKNWGVWITKELGLKGFRLDAVQHFSERFTNEWVSAVRDACGHDVFMVGEFWVGDTPTLTQWLDRMGHKFSLFDAPLLNNFSQLSSSEGAAADLRKVFDGSLVAAEPVSAVTVVANHDTQPGQTVETPIADFFKPLAYALILLRPDGYPSVFYGDLYGLLPGPDTPFDDVQAPACAGALPALVLARSLYAYGDCEDYFGPLGEGEEDDGNGNKADANCIGWVRRGTWDRAEGCAVVLSNAGPGSRRMCVGEGREGEVWTDVLGWARDGEEPARVTIGEGGWAEFTCSECSVSVWVKEDAEGRDRFPVKFDDKIYELA